jgi:tRNA wybutosine-synthesizing protein 3
MAGTGEKSRFKMTKRHHKETFERAVREGKMDKDLMQLCKYISKTKNFFTTSSCAGRIALVALEEGETKKESAFYRKWHRKVGEKEVINTVRKFEGRILWLKQEPLILHIGANTLENAKKILEMCEKAGIKRAGIKVAKEGKLIVELTGTQNISVPVKERGGIAANEEFLKYLVKKANEKFAKNKIIIKKLEKEARKCLK